MVWGNPASQPDPEQAGDPRTQEVHGEVRFA